MTENVNKEEIENDELICPITLELFRDPVKAKDGHVYERQAITRWILQHGTSPLTRQPLQINDLQSDDRLRNLARQRRTSTVSCNVQNDTVILPPLRRIPRNSRRVAPANINYPMRRNRSCDKQYCRIIIYLILFLIVPASIVIATIFIIKNLQVEITSSYSGNLTTNSSKFNRLNPSSFGEYYYDSISIGISENGFYEFQSQSSINMFAYFYQNSFNSININSNLLTYDGDSGGNYQFYFRISLNSNTNYILVATTYYNNTMGLFYVYATGPQTVTFNSF